MINVISAVLPVFAMLGIGMFLKKKAWISRKGIDDIKFLVSRIMLTVAVFHALSNATYSGKTWGLVGIMLLVELVTFGAGFLIRPLFPANRARYIPFLMSLYEGGMLAYPLYTNLCGSDALSNIALVDISGLLFGFSIWMGMLQQQEKGEPIRPRRLLVLALHTPTFVAAVLGVLLGVTGVMERFMALPVGEVYLGVEQLIVAPLNAMILLAVGYDMDLRISKIREVLAPIVCRALIQALAIGAMVFAVLHLFPGDWKMLLAVIIYMSVPTTFSMQTYVQDEKGCEYISTTNSIYIILTIVVYAICAMAYRA